MWINAYSTRRTSIAAPFVDGEVTQRRMWADDDPNTQPNVEFRQHLNEFSAWLWQSAGEQMTPELYLLLQHISSSQIQYAFEVDDSSPEFMDKFSDWAVESNSILYTEYAEVLDPHGLSVIPGDGKPAPGVVPIRGESVDRAVKWRRFLATEQQISVPDSLPPVRSTDELVPQTNRDLALRIICLALVADFSMATLNGRHINPADMQQVYPQAFTALSPTEIRLMQSHDPQLAAQLAWRVESLKELLWATGRTNLDWPDQLCDAQRVCSMVYEHREDVFISATRLRDLGELADEQERTRDIMWALREHQHFGGRPVPGTNHDIVMERLTAINWLLARGVNWDEVDTPT